MALWETRVKQHLHWKGLITAPNDMSEESRHMSEIVLSHTTAHDMNATACMAENSKFGLDCRDMRKSLLVLVVVLVLAPGVCGADWALYLNAFGETATAYANESCFLLGVVADAFVADIIQKNDALVIVQDVQKRIRRIRAKIRAVSQTQIADLDRQLLDLLDKAYACLDHQAWALMQYMNEKTPETARRFNEQRTECVERIQRIGQFFAKLPPPSQLSEPLSTR